MNIADELQKLEALRSSGAINDQEFAQAKALVLNGMPSPSSIGGAGLPSSSGETNPLRQFARSSRDKWLGGVCGGLGAHTEIPSWTWRVIFCLLLLSFGFGLVPYILLWIFVPLDESAG
jgi:phage shock protein C